MQWGGQRRDVCTMVDQPTVTVELADSHLKHSLFDIIK